MDKNWREEEQQMIAKRHENQDSAEQAELSNQASDQKNEDESLSLKQKKEKEHKAEIHKIAVEQSRVLTSIYATFAICGVVTLFIVFVGERFFGLPSDGAWEITLYKGLAIVGPLLAFIVGMKKSESESRKKDDKQ